MKNIITGNTIVTMLILVFLISSPLSAQIDWTADFVFDPFPSPYLSDWEANGNIGSVEISNNTSETIELVIFLSLDESQRGNIATAESNIFSFPPGSIENITTNDIIDYGSLDYNSDLEELIIRTGRLPEGEYTVCLELQTIDGTVLLSDICVTFTILYPDPPYLIFPFDSDTLLELFPTFQWTPVQVPIEFPIHYSLKIVETYNGQVPFQALQANPVHYEENYHTVPNLQYPLDALELIKGKRYAWQVQVLDENNFAPSSNDGKSEIFSFVYDPDTTTPPELYSISGRVWADQSLVQGVGGAAISYEPVEIDINGNDTTWTPYGESQGIFTSDENNSQDGRYNFYNCEEGNYFQIIVTHDDYQTVVLRGKQYQLNSNINNLDIELTVKPPGNKTLSGKAVDFFTNKPLPKQFITYSQVTKSSDTFNENRLNQLHTYTDEAGNFTFTQTADSSYFALTTKETNSHLAKREIGNHMYQSGDIDSLLFIIPPKAGSIEGYVVSILNGDTTYVKNAKVIIAKMYTAQIEERKTSYIDFFGKIFNKHTTKETKTISGYSGQKISVQTDENGYFICKNIQPEFNVELTNSSTENNYTYSATSQRLLSISEKMLSLSIEHSQYDKYVAPEEIKFVMGQVTDVGTHLLSARTGSISGTIASSVAPLENAIVRLYKLDDYEVPTDEQASDSGAWGTIVDVKKAFASGGSDAIGNFLLSNIPINNPLQNSDHYILEVTADGYYKQISEVRISYHGENVRKDFTLKDKPSIITGKIIQFSSGPVSGARIILTKMIDLKVERLDWDYENIFVTSDYTVTDGDGNYSFIDVAKGTYRLITVTPQNLKNVSDSFPVFGGKTVERDLVIKDSKNGSLAGVVKSSNDDLLHMVSVKGPLGITLYTTANGEFLLKDVPSGKMELKLTFHNHQDTTIEVTVPPDTLDEHDLLGQEDYLKDNKVEIVMERFVGTYNVKVLDAATNNVLANMEISIGVKSKTTNASVRVTFKDVDVGRQELKVSSPKSDTYDKDYVPFSSKVTVKVGQNTLKQIELVPGARMSGKVLASVGGAKISGVTVKIDGNDNIKATTAKDGTFTLKNLPAGKPITLVAQKPGFKVVRLSKNWSITAGDHIKDVTIKLEESPVDSLFGFAIILDSMTKASGSNSYLTGSIINIKNSFGLSFKDSTLELQFKKILVDENFKPFKDSFNLEIKEVDVKVFGFDGNMKSANGLKVVWIDSLSVGRISGYITLMDASSLFFPETKLGNMKIPKKKTPTFWSDGVNRSLQKFGLTATDTEVQVTFKGVKLGIDYTKTNIDSTGLHLFGSVTFKEKFKLGFENLHIANVEDGFLEFKGITIKTDPVPRIPFGVFTVYDSSTTWNETGFWIEGSLKMNKLSDREFGIKNVHVSKKGDFLSATVTADGDNSEISVHGQKFAIEEIAFGTDNWDVDTVANVQYLMMSGKLILTGLDKPVEFQNLKYTETDIFTGTIAFNQTKTFKNIVSVSLEEIVFDIDTTKGKFVSVSGGVQFGAIKGVKMEASNLQFYYDGKIAVDEIGLGFFAGPTEVEIRVRWTDTEFEGEGLLQVKPVIHVGAEFRYAGSKDWWVKIISGTRIPVGPAEIVEATGGVGLKDDTWRFMIGGTIAPQKSDKGINLSVEVNVYLKPSGVILTGSADVEVASSIHAGHGEFKYDIPKGQLDGYIMYVYDNDALQMNGQINFGVHFGKYWYLHGIADVNFLEFFTARGTVIAANNWPYYHDGETIIVKGIMVDITRDFYFGGDYGVIGWGVGFNQHATMDATWAGNFSGEINMGGNAHAYVGFDPFGKLRASGKFDLGAGLSKAGSEWKANGYGKFTLAASAGSCNASCNSICSGCAKRVWGVCVWPKFGGKVCVGMKANVKYSSNTGTDFSVSF